MPEEPASAWVGVYCLRPYNPWKLGGAQNPDFCALIDGRLLDLKDGKEQGIANAVSDFRPALQVLGLPPGTLLGIVPGHKASLSNDHRPLARVVHALAEADSRYVSRVELLVRTLTIPKQTVSGDRSLRRHLTSMRVNNTSELRGATVLLLDDTVTTGRSIEAARILLSDAGATVAAVALGRTVKYFESRDQMKTDTTAAVASRERTS
jgi:phosphoribosyl transferase-like protein